MAEKNPLQVCLPLRAPISKNKFSNKSGRPSMKNMIVFGPQPKSIVAQMLSEMKSKNIMNDEDDNLCINTQTEVTAIEDHRVDDYSCSICSHRSGNPDEHKKHFTQHKQFTCDYPSCNYSCKLSSNLVKHKRVHTNDKPYLCEKCSFRSNFVNSLKAHKRTHTLERPYQCSHCNYRCNSSSNLKKHYRHKHPNGDCHAKT